MNEEVYIHVSRKGADKRKRMQRNNEQTIARENEKGQENSENETC